MDSEGSYSAEDAEMFAKFLEAAVQAAPRPSLGYRAAIVFGRLLVLLALLGLMAVVGLGLAALIKVVF